MIMSMHVLYCAGTHRDSAVRQAGLCHIHAGLEDPRDLIKDLDSGFSRMSSF